MASTTLLRLSVGIEILMTIADLQQAFAAEAT